MRVFVAGATGIVGRRLVPALVAEGHEVTAMVRSPDKAESLRMEGVSPVVVDVFDRDGVLRVVGDSRPDAVIHQLSAIPPALDFRKFEQAFALTNRLRTEALDILLEAAVQAGASRFIAQSYTGWPNPRTGSPVKDESDPLDPRPLPGTRTTLAAIRHVEETMAAEARLHGIALRYGAFYGPGSGLFPGGPFWEAIRAGKVPIVGSGDGIWSFIHIDDAVSATIAALERGDRGACNIVDDDPAPVHAWLPHLAALLGGPKPRRVPAWLARLAIGRVGVSFMTEIRGSSNAKGRRELGWVPRYPSWREGFAAMEVDAGGSA